MICTDSIALKSVASYIASNSMVMQAKYIVGPRSMSKSNMQLEDIFWNSIPNTQAHAAGSSSCGSYTWACAGFVTAGCWIKIVCVQVKRSEQSVLTVWGPGARSRTPGGVQGQRPGGGPGGRAPGSSWVFRVFETPKRLSSHSFSFIFKTSFLQNHLIEYDIRWY